MHDSRDDIQLKIQRADKHLDEFRVAIREFWATHPYAFRVQRDPDTRQPIYRLAMVEDVPVNICLIAGDVIQNLRTSLDYLACALVRRNGKPVTKDTGFPIFDDAAKYQAGYARKVEGMRQLAIDAINAIKPYKGGDDTLWRLHRLNNIDKHRLLFTAQGIISALNPEITIPDIMQQRVGVPNAPFPLKEGTEIARGMPNAEMGNNILA